MFSDTINIVFLDVDGVLNSIAFLKANPDLHPDDHIDPLNVKRLNDLTDATGAKIVVSSTWRLPFLWINDLAGLKALLARHGVTGDIIGMTPSLNPHQPRGKEIQQWMDDSGLDIGNIVILDDDSDMAHLWNLLVKTDLFNGGLQDHDVALAIQILNKGA